MSNTPARAPPGVPIAKTWPATPTAFRPSSDLTPNPTAVVHLEDVIMVGAPPPDDTWREQAACLGHPKPDQWHPSPVGIPGPDRTGLYDDARAVCDECPVRAQCLAWAIANNERDGMWGGLTPVERSQLGTWIDVPKPRRRAAHGSYTRYAHGCTAGIEGGACEPCKRAKRAYVNAQRQAERVSA